MVIWNKKKLSSLIRLSVSGGQKTDSSRVVSVIGIIKEVDQLITVYCILCFFYVSQMLAWQFAGLAAIAVWTAALSLLLFGTLKLLRLLRVSEEIEMKG